ncbi:YqhA family protein [Beijerinckia indica]|uniref:YqhA family protein n=1 Tax=Beijerinckia indica TaxID=533 RepID=UPI0013051004|nr:YqhA family protein [Beijerinckia indica]
MDATILKLRENMGQVMFATRWIVAPIYIGLIGALCLIAIKFAQALFSSIPIIFSMSSNQAILIVLTLVDLSLVANLVVIVMVAGWQNFVGPLPLLHLDKGERPHGLQAVGFNNVKLKLISSTSAIAVIHLLETYSHIEDIPRADAFLQLAILISIPSVGVLLAWMDRISGSESA